MKILLELLVGKLVRFHRDLGFDTLLVSKEFLGLLNCKVPGFSLDGFLVQRVPWVSPPEA